MNTETDCPRNAPCTVTFERNKEASASVFDTKIELISATNTSANLKVAGIHFTVTKDES